MGLIKAISGSVTGALADQWKEVFVCDSLPNTVLVKKGVKKVTGRSSNTKGEDNIISNGSLIIVNNEQCAIITDNGKIRDVVMEPGGFEYHNDSQPSIFADQDIIGALKESWKRLGYGGQPGSEQRVYYVNTKEIIDNKYGTESPFNYHFVARDENGNLIQGGSLDLNVRCHGVYSFKIVDPIKFYNNIAGNIKEEYNISNIETQLKEEFVTALPDALSEFGSEGILPSQLVSKQIKIADKMDEILSNKWKELRGLDIISVGVKITLTPEDDKRLKDIMQMGSGKESRMADILEKAASNSGGSMAGFMGMNMANMGMNGMFGGAVSQGNNNQNQAQGIKCPKCGTVNNGKFCSNCGSSLSTSWKCECGTENSSNYCSNCGKKKPE